MITSQCGKLPCVQRTGSLPQRHYFSILRPRCKGAGRILGKVLAMLGRFCPRFPPSPRRFVKIVGNRPARHVLGRLPRFGPVGAGAQPAVPGYAGRLPCIVGRAFTPAGGTLHQTERVLARQGAAPLSRLCRQLPLQGSLLGGSFSKASPVRGCGCAVRRRRRGALPPCGGDILQSLAEPCPVLRRGRCLHRPGNLAMPQVPGGGRNRPPYIAAGAWRQRINASLSSGPPAGR